ncbi:MAG: tyrosine--tRNA ligase, partial [Desulfovibrio sp.]|nr:tyrosine--tRNA ligase [Desulfovibrio sp.]
VSSRTLDEITTMKADVAEGRLHPKAVKENLAFELVARYHSSDAALAAKQDFNAVFAGGGVPEDAPSLECASGEASTPPAFLEAAGLVKSRGEAKRLIKSGSLSIDGKRCEDAASPLPAGDYVVRLGRKRFLKLTVR